MAGGGGGAEMTQASRLGLNGKCPGAVPIPIVLCLSETRPRAHCYRRHFFTPPGPPAARHPHRKGGSRESRGQGIPCVSSCSAGPGADTVSSFPSSSRPAGFPCWTGGTWSPSISS